MVRGWFVDLTRGFVDGSWMVRGERSHARLRGWFDFDEHGPLTNHDAFRNAGQRTTRKTNDLYRYGSLVQPPIFSELLLQIADRRWI